MKLLFRPLQAVLVASLAGCVAIPKDPPAPTPARSAALAETIRTALSEGSAKSGQWPARDWWKAYRSPALDALVEKALADSPTMKVAASRLRAAGAETRLTEAADGVQAGLNGDVQRERYSLNGFIPPPFSGTQLSQSDLALNFSKELDVWGKVSSEEGASRKREEAARADLEAARLVLASGIAKTWFALAGTAERLRIGEANQARIERLLRLAKLRSQNGLESNLPVRGFETDLAQIRAANAQLRRDEQGLRYQLAALAGQGPDAAARIDVPARLPDAVAVAVPSSLPLDLISRRPDIQGQLLLAEAAGLDVAAAKDAFYPNINLTAMAGLQSIPARRLLNPASFMSQFGPAVHLPLLDGGRLKANLALKQALQAQRIEQYNATVIDASRDVAVALNDLARAREQVAMQQQVVDAAAAHFHLVEERWRGGLADYLGVLTARREVLDSEMNAARAREAMLDASLALVRALGGGYVRADSQRTASATAHSH